MADETPAPLSDAEIAAIAERAAKATPGPWDVWRPYRSDTEDMPSVNLSDAISWGASHYDYAGATIAHKRAAALPDATFIAAARTDIPRLLATIEAMRAEAPFNTMAQDLAVRLDVRLAALEAENAALREMLQEAAVIDRRHPNDPDPWFCDWCTSGAVEIEGTSKLRMVHQPDCWYTRARALLATQTPGATGATALYTDHADHDHDWQPIESRTAPDAEGHLIVWHRTQCRVCGLISEMSINPWQTPGTVVVQSEVEPAKPNDHTHEWESAGSRTETTDDEGNYHKWYRARCAHCGLIWEHS